jgi:hypothetical protein
MITMVCTCVHVPLDAREKDGRGTGLRVGGPEFLRDGDLGFGSPGFIRVCFFQFWKNIKNQVPKIYHLGFWILPFGNDVNCISILDGA